MSNASDKSHGISVPIDTKPAEYHDSTPKGFKIRGKHKPGSWVVTLGAGGNGAEAEAYRNGYDAIDWGKAKQTAQDASREPKTSAGSAEDDTTAHAPE